MAPSTLELNIPVFDLTVGGSPVPQQLKTDIVSLQIRDELNLPALLTLTLNLWDEARHVLKQEYLDQFELGRPLAVAIGLDETSPIFSGEVIALEPSFGNEGQGEILRVEAFDRLHRLRFGTKERTFTNMTDSEIASSIANEVGLTPDVEDSLIRHPHVTQENVHNLKFLSDRAKAINYEIKVEENRLFFRSPRQAEAPVASLVYRESLIRFNPRLRTVFGGERVELRGWDIRTKQPTFGRAGSGDEVSLMGGSQSGADFSASAFVSSKQTITNQTVLDADEAQVIAKAQLNRQQRDFIRGEGECPGTPAIRSGRTIEILDVGTQFSGIYYVSESTHTLGTQGYRTTFKVGRSAT